MDLASLDPDFFARQGAYTSKIYRDVYPAVDPASPTLSQKGKVVIITGSGSGLGARGLAPAFAQAGARAIVLVGRRPEKIEETAKDIRRSYPSTSVLEVPCSITDAESVKKLFTTIIAKYGTVDVLLNNAGSLAGSGLIADSDPEVWWSDIKTNVWGTYLMTHGFLNALGSERKGVIISITSGAATSVIPSTSGYAISKTAVNRLSEFVAAEHHDVTSVALDPGTLDTDMLYDAMRKFAKDTPALVGGTAVWLATSQAEFLRGRAIMTNWDVNELLARKDEILTKDDLKVVTRGQFGI